VKNSQPPPGRKKIAKFRNVENAVMCIYECETSSFTLRKEHRLRVLRRIFGPKREEVCWMLDKTA
jgi:hypothetical protein